MYKRVLVLCQRKVSKLTKDREKVESVVSLIDEYIALNTPVGTHEDIRVKVEYLTYHSFEPQHAYADHIFLLSRTQQYGHESNLTEKEVDLENFIKEHNNTYDVIILNTCQLPCIRL